jgi:hypothetical protein
MKYIQFYRKDALEVLRYTSFQNVKVGSIWCEAQASDADLETMRLNNWWFEVLADYGFVDVGGMSYEDVRRAGRE